MTRSPRSPLARAGGITVAFVAACGLAGCAILGFGTGDGVVRDDDGTLIEANDNANVLSLSVGDCIDTFDALEVVSTIPLIPCDLPHDAEVYAAEVVEFDEFPGTGALLEIANPFCRAEFEAFIGTSYLDTIYDFSFFFPTESSWDGGDREILCIVYDSAQQKVVGSLEGIQR